ncbi:hypothetical protein [Archangium sp.]|uniref:hypothetical protein n=1 Tax=Archangium sp. TaxID=1872627 RepID=UPI00286A9306|nr:hypothetical protein [Archangium sp.]
MRYAGLSPTAATATTSTVPLAVGSTLVIATPVVLAILQSQDKAGELQERLLECARLAERQVNFPLFGNRPPTREECGEELEVDGCPEPITRAMLLGRQKHDIALACAREVLEQLWPRPFSIEQRYRYYSHARMVESIDRATEQEIIKDRCTEKLRGSIKPDIVLHADYNLLQAALILDFKFPCPPSNPPRWTQYHKKTSAHGDLSQGEVYRQALGGEALIISPQGLK